MNKKPWPPWVALALIGLELLGLYGLCKFVVHNVKVALGL